MEKIISALRSAFNESKTHMARFELLPVVTLEEITAVENELGWTLPVDHAWFLTHIGRLVAYATNGAEYYRMLTPRESLDLIRQEREDFEETVFGEDAESVAAAHRELEVRLSLYPFQYMGHHVSDFHCFLMRGDAPVLGIFHDDFELADWLLVSEPHFHADAFARNFVEHLEWIACQMVSGSYGPSKQNDMLKDGQP